MELSEISKKKKLLEEEILQKLTEFEKETQLWVSGVDLDVYQSRTMGGVEFSTICGLKINVDIR
jgi:hypothetical protein